MFRPALKKQITSSEDSPKGWCRVDHIPTKGEIAREEDFHTILALEHRRAGRVGSQFVLMLFDSRKANGTRAVLNKQLKSILPAVIRETDLIGWYEDGMILGVLFTEVAASGTSPVTEVLHSRVVTALREKLHRSLASNLVISLQALPESSEKERSDSIVSVAFYPGIDILERPAGNSRVQTATDPA
jgi:hypothetical protein